MDRPFAGLASEVKYDLMAHCPLCPHLIGNHNMQCLACKCKGYKDAPTDNRIGFAFADGSSGDLAAEILD